MKLRSLSILSAGFCALLIGGCSSSTSTNDQGVTLSPSAVTVTPKGTPNFTSKPGKFSIHFPEKPQEKRVKEKSEWGDIEMLTYQSNNGAVTYIVIATPLPAGVDFSDSSKQISAVQEGFMKEAKGKVETSRDVTLMGMPGRDLHATMNNGSGRCRLFIYFTPKFSYQVMAVGEAQEFKAQTKNIDKVLTSFRFVDP